MGEEQKAAFLMAQTVAAQIELAAMQAENETRTMQGYSLAYSEEDFLALIGKYGIGHNQAIMTLRGDQ
jgi:ABC-type uncharacterized transport system ATPase component